MYGAFTYGNWNWNSTTKILTIISNATNNEGNTEGNAYSCLDIQNYGLLNSSYLNVTCGNQYSFNFRIIIGDGSATTWFVDTMKQIMFKANAVSGNWQYLIQIQKYGHFRVGNLDDADTKSTSYGCQLLSLVTGYNIYFIGAPWSPSSVSLYSSSFKSLGYTQLYLRKTVNVFNCHIDYRVGFLLYPISDVNLFNVHKEKMVATAAHFDVRGTIDTFERVSVIGVGRVIWTTGSASFTMRDLYVRGYTTFFYGSSWTGTAYLIDADVDLWDFDWSGTNTGEIYRQYSFKINVTNTNGSPIQNANVTMIDAEGIEEFTVLTGANGSFAEQIVTYGFYNQTGGNTPYLLTPHVLTITHDNYTTLNHTVTINEWKTVTQVVLYNKAFSVGIGAGLILGIGFFIIGVIAVGVKKKRD